MHSRSTCTAAFRPYSSDSMASRSRLPSNSELWLREKGAPWRSAHEFRNIAIDNKDREIIREKHMLGLAKQAAQGIESMYGRKTDWGLIQHILREACTLARPDLPSSLKPKVSRERAMWLKKVLNASKGFDIPALVSLLDLKTPDVFSIDMMHTAKDLYEIQSSGGNQRPISSDRLYQMKTRQQSRKHSLAQTHEEKVAERVRAIAPMFRAIKCQRKVYGRTMGQVRDAFVIRDKKGMGVMSREEFRTVMFKDLGLGLTEEQADAFLQAVDADNLDKIGYDEVLMPLHMDSLDFEESKVPKRCSIVGMRRHDIAKLRKSQSSFEW